MFTLEDAKEVRALCGGIDLFTCKLALGVCDGDVEVAAEFLKLKNQAFARHLDNDGYVALAKKNLNR